MIQKVAMLIIVHARVSVSEGNAERSYLRSSLSSKGK